jgi:hypothetical protein
MRCPWLQGEWHDGWEQTKSVGLRVLVHVVWIFSEVCEDRKEMLAQASGTAMADIHGGDSLASRRTLVIPAVLHFIPKGSYKNSKLKAIPVTGRGGPYGCETLRLPHFYTIGSQRWDCQPYAPAGQPATLYPQEDSWYSLLLEVGSTPGP